MKNPIIHVLGCTAILLASGCKGSLQEEAPASVEVSEMAGVSIPDGAVMAADFTLTDTDGQEHQLFEYLDADKTVVLEWFNPQCPVSRRYHSPERVMAAAHDEIAGDDIVWLAINSGAEGNQGHGLDVNRQAISDWAISYPVLIDESGTVGHAFGAKTTPHMFVIRPDRVIAYDGAIDDSAGQGAGNENLVVSAVSACRMGEMPANSRNRAFGCSVKY
ncbi:MAG: peroxiredoxin [Pseudohongiellaceae bacterium]|jgi:peroxiredoxin